MRTTLLTALMCWGGEWLGLASLWPTRVKYFWPPGFTFVHNCRILELLYECFLSPGIQGLALVRPRKAKRNYELVVGIGHLKDFLAGIHVPVRTLARYLDRNPKPHHLTPSRAFPKRRRSSTVMKFTNAYPTLHPGSPLARSLASVESITFLKSILK
jgi:hypothetical protein